MSLPAPYYEDEAVTIYHGDCREILPHLPKVGAAVVVGILYADGCRSSLWTVVHNDQAHSIIDKAIEIGAKKPAPSRPSSPGSRT